jgi:hypothetical protein
MGGACSTYEMRNAYKILVDILAGKRPLGRSDRLGEGVPLHAMKAPGGGGRYSSYSFSTSALDGGEWSASRPGRALPLGTGPTVPIVQEAGWASEPVWTQRLEEKSSVGNRTPVVQSVVRHYTH